SAASTAPPTAARSGSRCWPRTPTRAPPTSASTRPTRASCSPACGRRAATPGRSSAAGPGAARSGRRDAAATGSNTTAKGRPQGDWGKIGVAVAPPDGQRVYTLIEAKDGGLYRSDDGGEHWKLINSGHYLRQRAWYYTTLTVDPTNPDVVWCPTVQLLQSIDG